MLLVLVVLENKIEFGKSSECGEKVVGFTPTLIKKVVLEY